MRYNAIMRCQHESALFFRLFFYMLVSLNELYFGAHDFCKMNQMTSQYKCLTVAWLLIKVLQYFFKSQFIGIKVPVEL